MYNNKNLLLTLLFVATIVCIFILPFQLSCKRMNLSDITKNISARTLQIVFVTQQTESEPISITPIGTGFLVNNNGYVITAGHLIDIGEQYTQQTQAETKKLAIVIPLSPLDPNPPSVSQLPTNDFDVIARDNEHDLVLLKIKMSTAISPFNGETLYEVHYSNNTYGTLSIGDAHFTDNMSQKDSIAMSGYPSNQLIIETKTGKVTSMETASNISSKIVLGITHITYTMTDYYLTDIISSSGFSGSPVYSIKSIETLGICINIVQNKSEITAVIPSRYILELLKNNKITETTLRS
jgi:Trypsin-like peptidase domain